MLAAWLPRTLIGLKKGRYLKDKHPLREVLYELTWRSVEEEKQRLLQQANSGGGWSTQKKQHSPPDISVFTNHIRRSIEKAKKRKGREEEGAAASTQRSRKEIKKEPSYRTGQCLRSVEEYVMMVRKSDFPYETFRDLLRDIRRAEKAGDKHRCEVMTKAVKILRKKYRYLTVPPENRKYLMEKPKMDEEKPLQPTEEAMKPKMEREGLLRKLISLEAFKGVVGLKEAKEEIVWRFLLPIFFPEKGKGIRPKGGLLIYGPTGTGKTELMRSLLRICEDLGMQVLEVKPSTVERELIGAGEKAIEKVFERARERPSIIFIDEADGLLSERREWEPSYARTTLKQFLEEMDGLMTKDDKILVIACSNEPWKIAEPARRAGRLGTHIYVPPPDEEERAELFQLFLKDKPVEGRIDYKRLSELTKPTRYGYYSGADIMAICERAQIIALQSGRKVINMNDLEKASKKARPSISVMSVRACERFGDIYRPKSEENRREDKLFYTA